MSNEPIDHQASDNEGIEKKEKEIDEEYEKFKKEEEERKNKESETKKNKKEKEKKQFEEYNKSRIEIKDIFNQKKYEKGNFYDIVIKINLLNELTMDGWEIDYSPEFNFKEENIIPVSVIGEGNRGKSYLLGKITGHELPVGYNEKTEGISVKYIINDQLNVALIDSAGGQTPIIKNEKYDEYFSNLYKNIKIKELKKKLEENKDNKTNENDLLKNIEEIKNKKFEAEIIKNEDENGYNQCLKKLILDKSLTEQFIKDFVLSKSNIIIIVVGQITISEQLFINNLKNTTTKEIIIIHNLLNFVKKKQVEDYINDVLKKSIFFNLEEKSYTEMDKDNDNKNQKKSDMNNLYFLEKFENLDKEIVNIRHYIFANDSKESEAGNYYNYSTISTIRNIIVTFSNPKIFDIVEKLKEFLIENSYKYIDTRETNKINNQNLDEKNTIFLINDKNLIIEDKNQEINQKENKSKKFIMKLKEISNLSLNSIKTDETGKFKYTGNSFEPNYTYYSDIVKGSKLYKNCKEEDKNKDVEVFVIVIELAGEIKNFREKIILMKNGKFLISIWGEKKLPEITDISYLYSDLDENEFRIEFEVNMDEYNIDPKLKKSSLKNGIIKLYYELNSNKEKTFKVKVHEKKKKNNEKGKENNENNEEIKEESQEEIIKVQDKNNEEKKKVKKKNENDKKKK